MSEKIESIEAVAIPATYEKPRLEELGTFRELTQCGSIFDFLFGRNLDDCLFTGSTSHTWHHSYDRH